jgi:hypothetical protein
LALLWRPSYFLKSDSNEQNNDNDSDSWRRDIVSAESIQEEEEEPGVEPFGPGAEDQR